MSEGRFIRRILTLLPHFPTPDQDDEYPLSDAVQVASPPFGSHSSTPLRRRSRASSVSPPAMDSADEMPSQRTQSTLRRWFQSLFESKGRAVDEPAPGHHRR